MSTLVSASRSAESGRSLAASAWRSSARRGYVGASPQGSIVHVSVWDSEEHAAQMSHLKDATTAAQAAPAQAQAAGVTFEPKADYPIDWTVWPDAATRDR